MPKKEKNPEDDSKKEESKQVAEKKEEKSAEEPKQEGEKGYEGRFSQFKADNLETYNKLVEDAYLSSSKEGQRLSGELSEKEKEMEVMKKIVQSDPELKGRIQEKLYGTGYEDKYEGEEVTPTMIRQIIREENEAALKQNPVLQSMDNEKVAREKAIVEKFEKEHPEINTNPQLASDLEIAFGALARMSAQKQEVFDFEKTLQKAWSIVTGSQNTDRELEGMKKVIQKESASMTSTSSSPEPSKTKKELTEAEKEIASKLGLSEEEYLEGKKLQEK